MIKLEYRFWLRSKFDCVWVRIRTAVRLLSTPVLDQMYPFNRFLQREGNPTSKNWNERKSRPVFLYTTVTFHRLHSVFHTSLIALILNYFLCDDLFFFCKPLLSRSVNIVGFDLCYPFFMLLLDISCVLL